MNGWIWVARSSKKVKACKWAKSWRLHLLIPTLGENKVYSVKSVSSQMWQLLFTFLYENRRETSGKLVVMSLVSTLCRQFRTGLSIAPAALVNPCRLAKPQTRTMSNSNLASSISSCKLDKLYFNVVFSTLSFPWYLFKSTFTVFVGHWWLLQL